MREMRIKIWEGISWVSGMGNGIGAGRAFELFMGTVVKRVVRKSDHANNSYTCGPAIAKLDCITASLAEPSSAFHLLMGSFSPFLPAYLLKEWQCYGLTLYSCCPTMISLERTMAFTLCPVTEIKLLASD